MYRSAIVQLNKWKQKSNQKPLIIRGARQVEKTWLMKEFGKTAYKNTVYINFDNNPQMRSLFSADMSIERIITGLELYVGHKIAAENTLLIFDEIQEVPNALTSLSLLGCMVRLNQSVLLDGNKLFKEFKGALTEQYVLQQLKTLKGIETYYWTNDKGSAEVDFLIDTGKEIVPIEVKAEIKLKAKSLKTFCEKYNPKTAIRTSMMDYKREDWLLNLPLWAVETMGNL